MLTRALLGAAFAAASITGISANAGAQAFDRTAFDACNPEAWDMFGYAVEHREYGLLAEMLNAAQYKDCDFYETAELLVCEANPLACLEPSADVPDVIDNVPAQRAEGPFPGQRPGQSLGNENDGGSSDGGHSGGGSAGGPNR